MDLVIISDTHSKHRQLAVPDGDGLIHCGDITHKGEISLLIDFLKWFKDKPHPIKLFIAGNHDFCFQNNPALIKSLLEDYPDIIYLENSDAVVDGKVFWGSPWTPYFHNWAFNLKGEEEAAKLWSKIP